MSVIYPNLKRRVKQERQARQEQDLTRQGRPLDTGLERRYTCFALTFQGRNGPIMATFTRRDALRASAIASVASVVQASQALPTVPLGPHSVSRLIVGGNPISGNSHVSSKLSTEMRDYFTGAKAKKLLSACERGGINTWQSRGDHHIMRLLNEYRAEGGRIQWIAMTASEYGDLRANLREISAMQPIAIYHHGSVTDQYWNTGNPRRTLARIIVDKTDNFHAQRWIVEHLAHDNGASIAGAHDQDPLRSVSHNVSGFRTAACILRRQPHGEARGSCHQQCQRPENKRNGARQRYIGGGPCHDQADDSADCCTQRRRAA